MKGPVLDIVLDFCPLSSGKTEGPRMIKFVSLESIGHSVTSRLSNLHHGRREHNHKVYSVSISSWREAFFELEIKVTSV